VRIAPAQRKWLEALCDGGPQLDDLPEDDVWIPLADAGLVEIVRYPEGAARKMLVRATFAGKRLRASWHATANSATPRGAADTGMELPGQRVATFGRQRREDVPTSAPGTPRAKKPTR